MADAITVVPGATCLEAERLAEQVSMFLERFGRPAVDARISVEVEGDPEDPRKLAFTVRRDGEETGGRRFDPGPEQCTDLHAYVGAAIALAIDATVLDAIVAAEREPEPAEPEPEVRPAPPPKPESETPTPTPPKPKPKEWQLALDLQGGLSVGVPPVVGGFGLLGVEATWRDLVDVRLAGMAGSSGAQPTGEGSAVLAVAAGRVDACAGPRLRIVRPRGCFGTIAGAALATGQGFIDDQRSQLPWLAFALRADLRIRLAKRLELSIGAEGLANALRPAFDFLDPQDVRRAGREFPRFGGLFSLGLSVVVW